MWDKILTVLPDAIKSLFGIIDKTITDKDAANQLKFDLVMTIAGKGATSWLAQNAFSMAMLANFGLVVVLSLFGKQVPEWSIFVALIWLAGPLLNTLSKETLGKIIELVKDFQNEQKRNQANPDSQDATKTGG